MMQPGFREEEFSFRFTKLMPDVAVRLREQLGGLQLESRRPDVVAFRLQETTNCEALFAFLESESLDPGGYSVWVSVVTSSDHGGVSLPPYILDIVRRTRAGVDFSFVACTDG
jgi:hypothetical protein